MKADLLDRAAAVKDMRPPFVPTAILARDSSLHGADLR
jgi:hypothetical protein